MFHTSSARPRRLLTALAVVSAATSLTVGGAAAPAASATPTGDATGASSTAGATQFVDNFTGPAGSAVDPTLWTNQTGGGWNGGTQAQYYTPGTANAALTGNGTLMITARGHDTTTSNGTTYHYTSARLISKQAVRYGTMSARIRMTGSPGAFPAFWSMGANYAQVGWPACGEIDTMEAVNNYPNLYGSLHGTYNPTKGSTAYNAGKMISPTGGLGTAWHTYSADWTPTSVTYYLDGTPYVTVTKADLPSNENWNLDNPQNLILDLAVGGMAGTPASPATFNATMEVDWVKVTNDTPDSTSGGGTTGTGTPPTAGAPPPAAARTSARVHQLRARVHTSSGRRSIRLSAAVRGTVRVTATLGGGPRRTRITHRVWRTGHDVVMRTVPRRFEHDRRVMLHLTVRSGSHLLVHRAVTLRLR